MDIESLIHCSQSTEFLLEPSSSHSATASPANPIDLLPSCRLSIAGFRSHTNRNEDNISPDAA